MILISQKVGRNVGLGRVLFAGGSDEEKVGYCDKARVRWIGGDSRSQAGKRYHISENWLDWTRAK